MFLDDVDAFLAEMNRQILPVVEVGVQRMHGMYALFFRRHAMRRARKRRFDAGGYDLGGEA